MDIKYKIVGDRVEEIRKVTVHEFIIPADTDDPDIFAAQPLYEWEHSEKGQWVMKNACDHPEWQRMQDHLSWQYKYIIRAKFMGPALTEWLLRYGK